MALRPRAKSVIVLLSVGVLTTVVAVTPLLREQLYIWRLSSQEEATRREGAVRLGELKSIRAVPQLVECLRQNAGGKLSGFKDVRAHQQLWQPITLRSPGNMRALDAFSQLQKVSGINLVAVVGFPAEQEVTFPGGTVTVETVLRAMLDQLSKKTVFAVEDDGVTLGLPEHLHVRDGPGWLPGWKGMWASDALASIGRGAVPGLIELLDGDEPLIRILVLRTLALMGPEAQVAVSAVTARLDDDVGLVRVLAAAVLCRIGRPASEAVPRLEELRDDTNADLAMRAREALRAIRGE